MLEKRYLFTPGPTPVPPAGARGAGRAGRPPPRARLQAHLRALPRAAAGGLPHRARRAPVRLRRARGAMESAVVEPRLARRPRRSSSSPATSASAGPTIARAYGADVRAPALRVGRDACPRTTSRRASPRSAASTAVFLTHSETSTGVVSDVQALAAAARGSRRARASSTPSRASARCRSRPTRGGSTWSSPARRRR